MSNVLNVADVKEQVSLVSLLERLGFEPCRRSGKETLYLSMLRDNDTKPSFAVNEELNVWYDHGMGKGGTLIDFGQLYWGLTFRETLLKIQSVCELSFIPVPKDYLRPRRRHATRLPHYQIEDIKDMGNNYLITEYLQERGIWPVAKDNLKEIYYYVEDEKKLRKYFFAAGWQNELGSWEVRNRYFKGCLGHKGMTFVTGDPTRLVVFEGYFNYLSWHRINTQSKESVLILNSLSMLQASIQKAKTFSSIELFLDRDQAGHEASKIFTASVPLAKDMSDTYKGFNDFNDFLKSIIKISPQKATEPV